MTRAAKLAAAENKARAAAAVNGTDGDRAVLAMYDSMAISNQMIDASVAAAAHFNIGNQTILNALMQCCMNRLFRIDAHAATDLFACVVDIYRARANGEPTDSGPVMDAFYAAGARMVAIQESQKQAGAKH